MFSGIKFTKKLSNNFVNIALESDRFSHVQYTRHAQTSALCPT